MISKHYSILVLALVLFQSCDYAPDRLTKKQVTEIKRHFTPEEIVYFYETVFFIDPEVRDYQEFTQDVQLTKWNKDLYIKPFGDVTAQHLAELRGIVNYLNTLALPIKIHITEEDGHNVGIFYGDKEYIAEKLGKKLIDNFKGGDGVGFYELGANGYIDRADIGICLPQGPKKTNTALEELTQILGIPGDSYSHINSTFYQGNKNNRYQEKLLKIDERILQLLYSDPIPIGLPGTSYYQSFKGLIPDSQITEEDYRAFEDFLIEGKFSEKAVQRFYNCVFIGPNAMVKEPHIQKWRNDISYSFADTFSPKDSLAITSTIRFLSEYVKKPKIVQRSDPDQNTNLLFKYNTHEKFITSSNVVVGQDMLNYQLFIANIFLSKKLNVGDRVKEKAILSVLLQIMGLFEKDCELSMEDSIIFGSIKNSDMEFSQYDLELLQLFFSETLKSGMTKSKLAEILNKHYSL